MCEKRDKFSRECDRSPDHALMMFVRIRIQSLWTTRPNTSRIRCWQAPVSRRAMLSLVARVAPRSRHLAVRTPCSCARFYTSCGTYEHANPSVNALVHIASPAPRTSSGALSDYAIAVKDNICTAGMPTTCSSAMLANFTSPFDAAVVELLRDNGATLVGKTNCDEFGMG